VAKPLASNFVSRSPFPLPPLRSLFSFEQYGPNLLLSTPLSSPGANNHLSVTLRPSHSPAPSLNLLDATASPFFPLALSQPCLSMPPLPRWTVEGQSARNETTNSPTSTPPLPSLRTSSSTTVQGRRRSLSPTRSFPLESPLGASTRPAVRVDGRRGSSRSTFLLSRSVWFVPLLPLPLLMHADTLVLQTDLFVSEHPIRREPTVKESLRAIFFASWLNVLLVFIPGSSSRFSIVLVLMLILQHLLTLPHFLTAVFSLCDFSRVRFPLRLCSSAIPKTDPPLSFVDGRSTGLTRTTLSSSCTFDCRFLFL
jgi:hypothetical protein